MTKWQRNKKNVKKNISGSPVTFTHKSGCAEGWTEYSIDGTKKCFKYAGNFNHVDAMEECCKIGGIMPSPKLGWD